MNKPRKQANFRRRVAVLFFVFLLINVGMKFAGFSTLDATQANMAPNAFGMKVSYYVVPIFFLIMSLLFAKLSRVKSAEAESMEIGGGRW